MTGRLELADRKRRPLGELEQLAEASLDPRQICTDAGTRIRLVGQGPDRNARAKVDVGEASRT